LSYTHRLATLEDLPQIVEIYNSTIPSRQVTADTEPVSVESRRSWFETHTPQFRPLWVVEDQGRVIGWLSFSSFYGRPAYNGTEVSLYVRDGWRGRGVGSYLLSEALSHAPAIKVKTLLGFIFGHNEPSLRLFEKHGFTRWGVLPRVATFDGVERDLLILGRRGSDG
jgi:phosphinothricin acetyltransferase